MRMPLSRHGLKEMLAGCVFFGGAAALAPAAFPPPWWIPAGLMPLALLGFGFAFFRDPERTPPGDPRLVVSPADGRVADVTNLAEAPWLGGPAVRVGVFLSVFDVHVNRSPLHGRVEHLRRRPGRFLDARDPAAADENESQDLGLAVQDAAGGTWRVLVRQVSGLIARTIVCTPRTGDLLMRGERFGMIKFGSRTELYLPRGAVEEVLVKVGDKVRGGCDPLARIRVGVEAVPQAVHEDGAAA